MKSLLSALKNSGRKKSARKSRLSKEENDENASPLAPRRLLSATPEGPRQAAKGLQNNGAATVSGGQNSRAGVVQYHTGAQSKL